MLQAYVNFYGTFFETYLAWYGTFLRIVYWILWHMVWGVFWIPWHMLNSYIGTWFDACHGDIKHIIWRCHFVILAWVLCGYLYGSSFNDDDVSILVIVKMTSWVWFWWWWCISISDIYNNILILVLIMIIYHGKQQEQVLYNYFPPDHLMGII